MGTILFIIIILLIFLLLWNFFPLPYVGKEGIVYGMIIKLFYSFIYIYLFQYYFGEGKLVGDSANFYHDGLVLFEFGKTNPWEYIKLLLGFSSENNPEVLHHLERTQIWYYGDNGDFINDNRLIIKINSLIHFISFREIYSHVIIFSFISFIGIYLIYISFYKYVYFKKLFWWTLIATPSIAFWGGALLKESILIFAIGLYFYSLFAFVHKKFKYRFIIFLIIAIGILLFNKPYTGLILIPISILYPLGKFYNWKTNLIKYGLYSTILVFVIFMFLPSKINITEKISYKQKDLINMGKGGVFFINDTAFCAFNHIYVDHFEINDDKIKVIYPTQGEYKLFGQYEFYPFEIKPSEETFDLYLNLPPSDSYYDVNPIENSNWNLIKNTPMAVVNTMIRPYPKDPGDTLKIFSFIQNILLIGFFIFTFLYRKKMGINEKYIFWILFTVATWILLLIGWTIPIFGALVRYKIPAELFLIIGAFMWLKIKKQKHA